MFDVFLHMLFVGTNVYGLRIGPIEASGRDVTIKLTVMGKDWMVLIRCPGLCSTSSSKASIIKKTLEYRLTAFRNVSISSFKDGLVAFG